MGWEDKLDANSDDDFNDLFAVVQITPVPEPGVYLTLATFLGLGLLAVRCKRSKANAKQQV